MAEKRNFLERHKAFNEYLRFLTTLSTGSIVLLTSFLENLTSQPRYGYLISVSLTAFMISIIAAIVAYSIIVFRFGEDIPDQLGGYLGAAIFVTWVSFVVAIISLTVFALVNLY